MLYKILILLTGHLNDYLKSQFHMKNDIVSLNSLKEAEKAFSSNQVYISLVNVERETSAGISFGKKNISGNRSARSTPDLQFNLYVLFSVRFQEKQYGESIRVLSGILSFIQKKNLYNKQDAGVSFAIEPVNLSFQELANLWGILGGSYYPSILCKIKTLTVDEQEIIDLSGIITGSEESLEVV